VWTIDQYKSQSVFVLGAVRAPNEITMTGQLTLMAALASGLDDIRGGRRCSNLAQQDPATRGTMPPDQPADAVGKSS